MSPCLLLLSHCWGFSHCLSGNLWTLKHLNHHLPWSIFGLSVYPSKWKQTSSPVIMWMWKVVLWLKLLPECLKKNPLCNVFTMWYLSSAITELGPRCMCIHFAISDLKLASTHTLKVYSSWSCASLSIVCNLPIHREVIIVAPCNFTPVFKLRQLQSCRQIMRKPLSVIMWLQDRSSSMISKFHVALYRNEM